jgi:riboflavin synthase
MFTGLVAEIGEVRRARHSGGVLDLEIAAQLARDLSVGDSVAVNGVCLTATKVGRRAFRTEVMEETLERSSIGLLRKGSRVNLELPLKVSDRLGGHVVQGHVDGLARVARTASDGDATRVWFEAPSDLLRYIVAKGSVCLDGISLTVVGVGSVTFQVALIPHTLEVTTFGGLAIDDVVNVEVDILAKYVERLMQRPDDNREATALGPIGSAFLESERSPHDSRSS